MLEAHGARAMRILVRPMEIKIVPDESLACPGCGAYWGNPNKELDFPNRFKVDTFCRCYNPKCEVDYYDPFSGIIENTK